MSELSTPPKRTRRPNAVASSPPPREPAPRPARTDLSAPADAAAATEVPTATPTAVSAPTPAVTSAEGSPSTEVPDQTQAVIPAVGLAAAKARAAAKLRAAAKARAAARVQAATKVPTPVTVRPPAGVRPPATPNAPATVRTPGTVRAALKGPRATAIAAEQRFVDAVLDAAPSPVIVLDANGAIVRFNHACELLSGYTNQEVVGRPYWDALVPPDEIAAVRAAFLAIRDGGAPGLGEYHWSARSGARPLLAWAHTTLSDQDGHVTHLIGTGTDITERRRIEEALRGIEAVGERLARQGPIREVLDAVVGAIATQLGSDHVALFWLQDTVVRLGAQVGYPDADVELDADHGVVGRVLRTGEAALVPDVRADPDYRAGDPDVASEIAVPLHAEGHTFGVLTVESSAVAPLSEADLRVTQAVADRLSGALLLGREQRGLADRARMFAALTEFAATASSILQSERLWPALIQAVGAVVAADVIGVTVLEQPTGRYFLRAVRGMEPAAIGTEVRPGEGASGQAIATRAIVTVDDVERRRQDSATRSHVHDVPLSTLAVPLIRDDAVLGAITVGRAGSGATFSRLEAEAMTLLGAQAALALANARLLDELSDLAIHDGLTGLFNRRHFDATLELVVARWRREIADARPLSAILFDLDHFGRFNKEHGHQAGDAVLREFGDILRERFRAADLVGRYGGEEFVVIMENTTREQALVAADEVRQELESRMVLGPDGQVLRAHVSAGCAALDPTDASPEAFLRTADVALAMAKRAGRNQVVAA